MSDSAKVSSGVGLHLWRLNPSVRLCWRVLDDEWLLFESRSGQTHLFAAHAAAVLMALESGGVLSVSDIHHHFERDLASHITSDAVTVVTSEFAKLGLIVPFTAADAAHVPV